MDLSEAEGKTKKKREWFEIYHWFISSEDKIVDIVCNEIKGIASRTGVEVHGPVPLPTKRLWFRLERAPMEKVHPHGIAGK